MRKEILIGLMVAIILMNVVFVSSKITIIEGTVKEKPKSFWEILFPPQDPLLFSIVGIRWQCDKLPRETWCLTKDSMLGFVNECPSGWEGGLVDVFEGRACFDYGPEIGEFEADNDRQFTYTCNKEFCTLELYCCEHMDCDDEDDCEDWFGPAGSGKQWECETTQEEDPNIPFERRTWSYCDLVGADSPITCWRIKENKCEYSTYPSTYEGYPDCPNTWPYTSKQKCEDNIEEETCEDYATQIKCISVKGCHWWSDESCNMWTTEPSCNTAENCVWNPRFRVADCVSSIGEGCMGEISNGVTNGEHGNQKGLLASQLRKMTAEDLASSACTTTKHCELGSECQSLQYLINTGGLTKSEGEGLIDSSAIFFGAAGGVGAVTACASIGVILAAATAGAGSIIFPLCALAGGVFGATAINDIWETFAEKDLTKAGYCIKESDGFNLDKWFKWAAFFDVTGDGVKDGMDGLIICIIAFVILVVILK